MILLVSCLLRLVSSYLFGILDGRALIRTVVGLLLWVSDGLGLCYFHPHNSVWCLCLCFTTFCISTGVLRIVIRGALAYFFTCSHYGDVLLLYTDAGSDSNSNLGLICDAAIFFGVHGLRWSFYFLLCLLFHKCPTYAPFSSG